MHIKRGIFTAHIDAIRWQANQTVYRVRVVRKAVTLYEQIERRLEEARRVAEAYLCWEQKDQERPLEEPSHLS